MAKYYILSHSRTKGYEFSIPTEYSEAATRYELTSDAIDAQLVPVPFTQTYDKVQDDDVLFIPPHLPDYPIEEERYIGAVAVTESQLKALRAAYPDFDSFIRKDAHGPQPFTLETNPDKDRVDMLLAQMKRIRDGIGGSVGAPLF